MVGMATLTAAISCQAGHLVVIWALAVEVVGLKPWWELAHLIPRCLKVHPRLRMAPNRPSLQGRKCCPTV